MDNGTIFYISGAVLAVSAVLITFVGLKASKFPGKAAPVVVLWFVVFAGLSATFAVRHSKDEEVHREHEAGLPHATEESEREEAQ